MSWQTTLTTSREGLLYNWKETGDMRGRRTQGESHTYTPLIHFSCFSLLCVTTRFQSMYECVRESVKLTKTLFLTYKVKAID